MKNPNSKFNRTIRWIKNRWSSVDFPKAEPRFHFSLLIKDIAIFILLPLVSGLIFRTCGNLGPAKHQDKQGSREFARFDNSKSQIIEFKSKVSGSESGIARKSTGTLVKVKLLNVVETYSAAPVHAQIIDNGLGNNLRGGTIIGEAIPDASYERINISFRIVRDPTRDSVSFPLSARALSLDGSLGLDASKKQGFVARAVIDSASEKPPDIKDIIFKALTAGLVQEFGTKSQVEKNRAQLLTLEPQSIFFVELTDSFPRGEK